MSTPELAQIEMLAQVDDLVHRLTNWMEEPCHWEPVQQAQAMIRRLLGRVDHLRIRLESPLIVATFGGTGTGKSTLVNALVGRECTESGRQRPTTTRPILIAHSDVILDTIGLPIEDFEIVQTDAPILRDLIIIDCPDPDTSETAEAGTNLEMLRNLLPHCDVLIYTTTQQKYRSARVVDELKQASEGCRLLFVQTHAELDADIRTDWRKQLDTEFHVPDVFFVDSLRALKEQAAGQRPSGDFSRLLDLLTTQLAASQRVKIRRANLIDLIHAALVRSESFMDEKFPAIEKLQSVLQEQQNKLTGQMSDQLQSELSRSQNLWERRLLATVTQYWGVSPFSSVLRFYNGIGSFIASFSFFRARTSAHMAIIGAMEGLRRLRSRSEEQEAEARLNRIGSFGLSDLMLRESQLIVSGYVKESGLDIPTYQHQSLDSLRSQAARVEEHFLDDAVQKVDGLIDHLAIRNTSWFTRMRYEILFLLYLLFILFRIGKNFFYDTFLVHFLKEKVVQPEKLLTMDFYIPAAIFFLVWTLLLIIMFTMRLRRGLTGQIKKLSDDLSDHAMAEGLFPRLEQGVQSVEKHRMQLQGLIEKTEQIRRDIASAPVLGERSVSSLQNHKEIS